MLNGLFVTVTLGSVVLAAFTGQMEALTDGVLTSASNAVELAIGLVGSMTFFLGLMKVVEDAGAMDSIARAVRPLMRFLFPSIPSGSPAIGAIVMNMSANMLGLVNAATPFGIRAMQELDKLNSRPGTATNAMAMFLAINTSALAILPSGMIALRVSLGSEDPAGIFFTTWFASGCATVMAIAAATLLARLPVVHTTEPPTVEPASPSGETTVSPGDPVPSHTADASASGPTFGRLWAGRLFWIVLLVLAVRHITSRLGSEPTLDVIRSVMSFWSIPLVVAVMIAYGWVRRVRVYESLVEGGKQGFQVALRIIPFLVAILVMVGMFRASGGLDILVRFLAPITALIGMPAEVLPLAMLRPLTGSGAFGVAAETMQAHGPDSLIGYMAGTFTGSTETTFYTLAVYYGAIGVRVTRHTVPACLAADVTGVLAATFIVNLVFG